MRISLFSAIVALVFIYSVTANAQKRLSVIGSSTAACFLVNGDSCFVGRLQRFYGSALQINNLAVAGSNVYRGMPTGYVPPPERFNEVPDTTYNITAALKSKPDVVLVNYPSNGYDLFSVREVMQSLRTIYSVSLKAGARCYITSSQPRSEPASYSTSETRKKMAEIKDSVLKEFGDFAINFWDGIVNIADSTIISELGQGDGTHLNNKGHAVLFQKVLQKNIFGAETPLPVRFVRFIAEAGKDENILHWQTVVDGDLNHYDILKSADGIHFKNIGRVEAEKNKPDYLYSFTDAKTSAGLYHYQVAAIMKNGGQEYSRIVSISREGQAWTVQKVHSSGNLLYIQLTSAEKQAMSLQVLNSSGQLITRENAILNSGNQTITVNFPNKSGALYFIRISDSKNRETVRSFMH